MGLTLFRSIKAKKGPPGGNGFLLGFGGNHEYSDAGYISSEFFRNEKHSGSGAAPPHEVIHDEDPFSPLKLLCPHVHGLHFSGFCRGVMDRHGRSVTRAVSEAADSEGDAKGMGREDGDGYSLDL